MGWTARDLVTIGYWAIRPAGRPDWLGAPHVLQPCNLTHCNEWPEAAQLPWLHNTAGVFDSVEMARAAVPSGEAEGLLVCGGRALPVSFDGNEEQPWVLPASATPIPVDFVRLGFDVVEMDGVGPLACSPLLCNHQASKVITNRWCLFDDIDAALAAARTWTERDAEPGPYVVIEVWAERLPAPP